MQPPSRRAHGSSARAVRGELVQPLHPRCRRADAARLRRTSRRVRAEPRRRTRTWPVPRQLRRPHTPDPGQVYRLTIELGNISHLVKGGHALRLLVTSSDFPRWDRTNTGDRPAAASDTQQARQTILHDRAHASRLILPTVSAAERR
ncbi:hypothetical protein I1A62_05965 (plasmid) [Rhodococcus sp. USK10]|nr:hypothetical protein I1A62_05965 [Rhodococcus sp. USK10]